MTPLNGTTLIKWGFSPGPQFPALLRRANELALAGQSSVEIIAALQALVAPSPVLLKPRAVPAPLAEAITATCEADEQNIQAVRRCMSELLVVPCIERGAIMPDACPAGAAPATIPVGGVIAVRNGIIPGAHSADICCSMNATFFAKERGDDIAQMLDILKSNTRFGAGGRRPDEFVHHPVNDELVWQNPFLRGLQGFAQKHMNDQGDGNHFCFVGEMLITASLMQSFAAAGYGGEFTGLQPFEGQAVYVLVTHHGSRGLGAQVYKRGQAAALEQTNARAQGIPNAAAWFDYDTQEGKDYWDALQYVRRWTLANHETVHARFLGAIRRAPLANFGNAHNFVWKQEDAQGTVFLHGKGATPAWSDESGRPLLGLIPLNMAAPILIVLGRNNPKYLSFCPHGAGRNFSRTHTLRAHQGNEAAAIAKATEGIDVRWYYGKADLSETPLGYKSAAQVRAQIEAFDLATVVGEIKPLGCIMAGDSGPAPWQRAKLAKKANP